MLHDRYQRWGLLLLTGVVSLYLVLPLTVSWALTNWLRHHGYQNVIVQLGYPGWRGLSVPVVSFQQDLGDERLMISLTDIGLRYSLSDLLQGQVDRVDLPYVAVQVLSHPQPASARGERVGSGAHGEEGSPWNMVTAGDLLRRLPVLPFREVRIEEATVFREQATGPLRKVSIKGVILQQAGELGGHLTFNGRETASYGLTVSGHSASTWSATLVSQRPQALPILTWQSTAQAAGEQVHVEGKLEINVREVAPFIALMVPIGPELEKVSGHVVVQWTGTAASKSSLRLLRDDPYSTFDGTFQSTVALPAVKGIARNIALACSGRFAGNPTRFEWTVNPGVLFAAAINTQPQFVPEIVRALLPHGDQPLRVEHMQAVHGALYWTESPLRLTVEGPVSLMYGAASGPLVAEFRAENATVIGGELDAAQGTFRIQGAMPPLVTSRLAAKEAVGTLYGQMVLAQHEVKGQIMAPSALTVTQVHAAGIAIARASLHIKEPVLVQCALTSGQCTGGSGTFALQASTSRLAGYDLKLGEGALVLRRAELVGASWNVQGALSLQGVTIEPLPLSLPATNWRVEFSANQAGVKADAQGHFLSGGRVVTAKIEQGFSDGKGSLRGSVGPLQFNATEQRLRKLVPALPPSIDLIDGRFTATADLAWSVGGAASGQGQGLVLHPGSVTVQADNLSGLYRDVAVQGVSTTLVLRTTGFDQIATRQPAAITIASVQTGVEVSNITTTVDLSWTFSGAGPVVDLRDIQGELFGGTMTSPGAHFDPAKPPARLTISLREIDLARVLAVEQQKGIEGAGLLNGTLPLTITATGVSVKDGMVEAQSPGGVIRYVASPDAGKLLAESDHSLKLVGQALNNFHYTVLRVGVQYHEDGLLQLAARLEGKNPDLKKTPPIHFNLTVQENIPALLKSLRLVQDIEASLEQRVRRR
ncbi:MAG: YdbH domain-containing protein [Nitrospira sp.]